MTTPGQPQPPTTVLDLAQSLWDAALDQARQAAQQQWESAQAELTQQRSQLTADRAELERERLSRLQTTGLLLGLLGLVVLLCVGGGLHFLARRFDRVVPA